MHMRVLTIVTLLLAAAVPAWGGDDHDHGHGHHHDAKHGGVVLESGHHHLEVVARDGTLEVYVEGEDGKAEDLAGAKATAVILSEGKKFDVTLAPGDGGALKGTGAFKATKGTTFVITLTMPDHAPEQVRFKLD